MIREYRTLDELDNIQLEGKNGPIALSLIVQKSSKNKTGKITRVNSMRSKNVRFDVIKVKLQIQSKGNNKKLVNRTKRKIFLLVFFAGQEEDQLRLAIKAFIISLFLITIILIATFDSFILLCDFISCNFFNIGVMIGLITTGKPFGIIMSGIGVIALAGIVVNNNIVLLDTYKELK